MIVRGSSGVPCAAPGPVPAEEGVVGRDDVDPPPHAASIDAAIAKAESFAAPCICSEWPSIAVSSRKCAPTKVAARPLCKNVFSVDRLYVMLRPNLNGSFTLAYKLSKRSTGGPRHCAARQDVHVQVTDRLPPIFAGIDDEAVAAGLTRSNLARDLHELPYRRTLRLAGVVGDVCIMRDRHHQHVPRGLRIDVFYCDDVLAAVNEPRRNLTRCDLAENAFVRVHLRLLTS